MNNVIIITSKVKVKDIKVIAAQMVYTAGENW